MIILEQEVLERFLESRFVLLDTVPGIQWLEVRFSSKGLLYVLVIDIPREWIWLRADPVNADQSAPAFEFTFRSDTIRSTPGGFGCEAIHFDFADGAGEWSPEHTRLVIERLPSGDLYTWPVLGKADGMHPRQDSV